MSDESNSESFVSEVDRVLDDIFGEDQGGSTPVESEAPSPLDELRGLVLTIDREISEGTVTALNNEVKKLERSYAGDTHLLALLKIMSLLVGYMKLEKGDVHPDTPSLLNSAFQCMKSVAGNKGMSTHEKITLIRKEIDKFNKFKVEISPGGKPSARKTVPPTGETAAEHSEPPPAGEPSSATVSAGEIFAALDDLRSCLGEQLAALRSGVDGLKEAFTRSEDSRAQLGEEFMSLKGQVNDLGVEVSRLRDDLRTARSELEIIRGAVHQVRAAPLSDESAQDEAGIEEVEESRENSEATDWHLLEHDIIVEEPSSADKPHELQTGGETTSEHEKSEDREEEAFDLSPEEGEPEVASSTSGSYFLFQMGGRKYAVDESSVIKASKADRHLLKKASDKGELTMIDCKRMFSSMKRGIEPAWNHLASKDLEKTTFRVLADDRIDGLLDTNGGGMLFLGSGEERSILFTDQLPKKKQLSRKNKVKRLSGLEYVYGAIQKGGDTAKQYLILDADQLCKRLRVCIPSPFTKI